MVMKILKYLRKDYFHNIKITNKKEPYVKVRKNDKWELQDKKEILENLVDKNIIY